MCTSETFVFGNYAAELVTISAIELQPDRSVDCIRKKCSAACKAVCSGNHESASVAKTIVHLSAVAVNIVTMVDRINA